MTEVTRILSAIDQGDPHAAEQLLPLVHDELRRVNRVRDKQRLQRGGARKRLDLDPIDLAPDTDDGQLIALDEALAEWTLENPGAAQLVNLRFFAGLTRKDAADKMGFSAALRSLVSLPMGWRTLS
jgi:hypothetical protein